jgi:OOP family OmpA-OmpF porin
MMTLHGTHFAFNKAVLTAVAKDTLNSVVPFLKEHGDAMVEIDGYTDSIGSDAYNQKLSERRANAVKAYLVSQGIAASRITAKGFGKSQPVADNATEAGRAANRRAVVIELP